MQNKTSVAIKKIDFDFENTLVRITANRNSPEIKLVGLNVEPFEEGNEYEIYHWIAQELEKSGIVHFREDEGLSSTKLSRIQWTERVQTAGQISKLPESFYPKLRRFLSDLKKDSAKTPEKLIEYEKNKHLTKDIVSSRLRKIVSIASAPAQTEQALKNFTKEERFLYGNLYRLINEWRTQILKLEENVE